MSNWYIQAASAAERGVPAVNTNAHMLKNPSQKELLRLLQSSPRVRTLVTPQDLYVADWNNHTHQSMAQKAGIQYVDEHRGYIDTDSNGDVYWDQWSREHPQAQKLGFDPLTGFLNIEAQPLDQHSYQTRHDRWSKEGRQ